jgi:hypothetical protein
LIVRIVVGAYPAIGAALVYAAAAVSDIAIAVIIVVIAAHIEVADRVVHNRVGFAASYHNAGAVGIVVTVPVVITVPVGVN